MADLGATFQEEGSVNELQKALVEKDQLSAEVASLRRELDAKTSEIQSLKQQLNSLSSSQPAVSPAPPLLWKGCARLPNGIVRPHVAVKGEMVFVGAGSTGRLESSRMVHKLDTVSNLWSTLPLCQYYTFSLVVVKGYVTVIGGIDILTSLVSNALASFDEDHVKWGHVFPAMPTKRSCTSSVSTESYVVVTGGIGENDRMQLDTVEVLDLNNNTWARADSLPNPVTFMSITACPVTARIYMTGGLKSGEAIRSVFSCSIPELVESCHTKTKTSTWEVITDAPYFRSGCTAIDGKLVIASGQTVQGGKTTTTLHSFDPNTKGWEAVGEMPAARSSCSLAVLGSHRLIVVGGYVNPRNWISSLTTDVMETVNLKV